MLMDIICRFLNNSVIAFGTFYGFAKLLKINNLKQNRLKYVIFIIIFSNVEFAVRQYLVPFNIVVYIFILSIFNLTLYKKPVTTTIAFTIISFTLIRSLDAVMCLLTMPITFSIYYILYKIGNLYYYEVIMNIIVNIADVLVLLFIFRIRRFKDGIIFLEEKISKSFGVIISIIFCIILSFECYLFDKNRNEYIFIFIFPLFIIFILMWWQNKLKKEYLKKIQARNVEIAEHNAEALHQENERLRHHNDELSKIIHKDNKLIPAMEMTVRNLLLNVADEVSDSTKAEIMSLKDSLEKMSSERKGIVLSYENENLHRNTTGYITIDAILLYMTHKAEDLKINFDYEISDSISAIINDSFTEGNLNTLLADLIENALIAVSFQEKPNKSVKVHFHNKNDIFRIDIYDTGIPFQSKTIENLGRVRSTTHSDTGGTGIGLMSTTELLSNAKASFEIDENLESNIFSKKISACFDALGEIRVHSSNPEIITVCKRRSDIIVLNSIQT